MKFVLFLFFLLSIQHLKADEFQSTTQYININQRNNSTVGFNQELLFKTDLRRNVQLGVLGTYLERFELFEKRGGIILSYLLSDEWSINFNHLVGFGNKILPEEQSNLNLYHRLMDGISPFLFLRGSRYTDTDVNTFTLGIEIEKISNLIFIPTLVSGKASFNSPANTEDIYNYGLKIIYYVENSYSVSFFGNNGNEASQAVKGSDTKLIDTYNLGLSLTLYPAKSLKAELILDQTRYDQLDTSFQNSTLNLTWML